MILTTTCISLFYFPAFICKVTIPVLLGICQAISANSSGSTPSDSELLCHKQCKKCSSDFRLKSVKATYDNTDGATKSKTSVFLTAVSASQLQTIVTQIESLVLSQSLPELDTILSELNQVNAVRQMKCRDHRDPV
jgi:hypothetical protein